MSILRPWPSSGCNQRHRKPQWSSVYGLYCQKTWFNLRWYGRFWQQAFSPFYPFLVRQLFRRRTGAQAEGSVPLSRILAQIRSRWRSNSVPVELLTGISQIIFKFMAIIPSSLRPLVVMSGCEHSHGVRSVMIRSSGRWSNGAHDRLPTPLDIPTSATYVHYMFYRTFGALTMRALGVWKPCSLTS